MPYSNDSLLISRLRKHLEDNLSAHLDLLQQMVAINSFTANPVGVDKLGHLTAAAFAELGFTAQTVQCETITYGKHLILTRAGRSGRKIGLVSHLDTVFPPDEEERNNFNWRPEGDRIYGPGTVDIKGGTLIIYMILTALKEELPQVFEEVTWLVMLNAAEETVATDFSDLCLDLLAGSALACLVFEMGFLNRNKGLVVVARKGMALFRVKVAGRAAHAGSAHPNGANAVVQLAKTIQQIDALTDYEQDITFNIGTVAGGTVLNRVPHYAVSSGEMRAFSPAIYNEGLAQLLALANQVNVRSPKDSYPCSINIDIISQTPPWPRNKATDQLLAVWQEAGQMIDLRVSPQERGGLSDGNATWSHIPTIDGLGPSGANAHCSEHCADGSKEQEYVTPSSFIPKTLLNIAAILILMDRAGESRR